MWDDNFQQLTQLVSSKFKQWIMICRLDWIMSNSNDQITKIFNNPKTCFCWYAEWILIWTSIHWDSGVFVYRKTNSSFLDSDANLHAQLNGTGKMKLLQMNFWNLGILPKNSKFNDMWLVITEREYLCSGTTLTAKLTSQEK